MHQKMFIISRNGTSRQFRGFFKAELPWGDTRGNAWTVRQCWRAQRACPSIRIRLLQALVILLLLVCEVKEGHSGVV